MTVSISHGAHGSRADNTNQPADPRRDRLRAPCPHRPRSKERNLRKQQTRKFASINLSAARPSDKQPDLAFFASISPNSEAPVAASPLNYRHDLRRNWRISKRSRFNALQEFRLSDRRPSPKVLTHKDRHNRRTENRRIVGQPGLSGCNQRLAGKLPALAHYHNMVVPLHRCITSEAAN